jgi:hypothetical protein
MRHRPASGRCHGVVSLAASTVAVAGPGLPLGLATASLLVGRVVVVGGGGGGGGGSGDGVGDGMLPAGSRCRCSSAR